MTVTVKMPNDSLANLINSIMDSETMREINQALANRCDPYVPYNTGDLSRSGLTHVTSEGVTYDMPYAAQQYTGTEINHNLVHHPKATAYWDVAMIQEQGEEFAKDVEEIISRRVREINGK